MLFLIPLLIVKNDIPAAFFRIDLFVLLYLGYHQKYCPGSLCIEIYVLRTGKKFVKVGIVLCLDPA